MALFGNGKPEEFLFFVRKFRMTIKASGALDASTKIQYLRMLILGVALRQLDMLSIEVRNTTTTPLNRIILGLCAYFFPIKSLSKQKRSMRHAMMKSRKLQGRRYSARMVGIN